MMRLAMMKIDDPPACAVPMRTRLRMEPSNERAAVRGITFENLFVRGQPARPELFANFHVHDLAFRTTGQPDINPPPDLAAALKAKGADLYDPKWVGFYQVADRSDAACEKFLVDWFERNGILIDYRKAADWTCIRAPSSPVTMPV